MTSYCSVLTFLAGERSCEWMPLLGQGLAPAAAAKIIARCTNDQAQVPEFPRSFSGGGQRRPTDSPMTLLLEFFVGFRCSEMQRDRAYCTACSATYDLRRGLKRLGCSCGLKSQLYSVHSARGLRPVGRPSVKQVRTPFCVKALCITIIGGVSDAKAIRIVAAEP